jgi:hypothetical protein
MTPKGGKTQTTTQKQQTEYPQWTQDALQNLVTAGGAMNAPFIQTPSYAVAGMNPDQLKAFDLARQGAQAAYSTGPVKVEGNPYASAAKVGAASQVNPNAIAEGLNPYLGAVLKPALAQAERSRDQNQAAIGARAAASGSFGGSREAIERGQADRAYQEGTASMVANLMAQGWDQASALAQTNAQMQQQATLAQAGYDQQAGMYNAGVPMELARLQSGLTDANQARQQSALQALLGIGNQQQAFGQSVLDTPYTALARYAALVPQQLNSVTNTKGTAPNTAPSPLQSLLGIGATLGGAYLGGPAMAAAGTVAR